MYSQDLGRPHCSKGENELLSLLKAWQVPAEGSSLPIVQSTKELKEILCTSAAFLQGLCGAGTHVMSAQPHTALLSQDTLSLPLSWFLFPSKPTPGVFWAGGFLGCSFGRGTRLSLWVSTLPFGIQRTSRLFPELSLSLHCHGVLLPV